LTWLHLLPSDSTFEVVGPAAPSWLRWPPRQRTAKPGQPTLVGFQASSQDSADLTSARAFVGINCRGLHDGQLRAGGLTRIDRYAVLPNWENPRWFIPLASPCVSSAGFHLYTPAKTSARLKRFAARLAVHSRVPFWYRDQLLLARREAPPLEVAMGGLFPGRQIHFALSAGAPEGARNRKASAAVIDSRGNLLAFLKLAASDLATGLLHREAEVLRALASTPGVSQVVPRLLAAQQIDGTYVIAQAPLAGGPAPTALTASHRRLLDTLAACDAVHPAETQLVRGLVARISSLPVPRPQLSAALDRSLSALSDQRIRVGAVHGDFAPWNLRLHEGRITAFDWEYGSLEGPAGLDEIHYRLQVGYLLNDWTVETAMKELAEGDVLDHYLSSPQKIARHALIALYLVDVLTRLYNEGYDGANDMVAWNERLLVRLELPSRRPQSPREAVPA
jgi:hypothetical protein